MSYNMLSGNKANSKEWHNDNKNVPDIERETFVWTSRLIDNLPRVLSWKSEQKLSGVKGLWISMLYSISVRWERGYPLKKSRPRIFLVPYFKLCRLVSKWITFFVSKNWIMHVYEIGRSVEFRGLHYEQIQMTEYIFYTYNGAIRLDSFLYPKEEQMFLLL